MVRLAINGFGRIGRCVLRALYESGRNDLFQVVAINEPADLETMAHLLKYDSTHGRFPGTISMAGGCLLVGSDEIAVSHAESVDDLAWPAVDLLLECSGSFDDRETAEKHLACGAGKLLFSQPAQPDVDATVVFGVNHEILTVEQRIVSAASCTTNCIVPVIKGLDDAFGIESGVITTIHSAMNDQPVLDAYHHTDLRKTRAATQSIIPIETALARGIDRVLPDLAGLFEAQALRVPTTNVSCIDLSVVVKSEVTETQVNQALSDMAENRFHGVLGYTEEPLASCDFNHDPRSAVIDASQTRVGGGRLVKVLAWFDNEWGYANRLLDVAELMTASR